SIIRLWMWQTGAVDEQRHLVEWGERCLQAVEKRDIPIVDQDLDILPELSPLKYELLERWAHDLLQHLQELLHRTGIDPERSLSRNPPDSAKESYFSHRE
ncbi:MAG TPA: hypothetical protein VN494_05390, partial [Patescibacteria group bacterium]|nr:hypothetical protein [Patescibacteria group bacterium]